MKSIRSLLLLLLAMCIASPAAYAYSGITTIAFTAADFENARKTHSYRVANEFDYSDFGGPDALITERPYTFAQMAYTDQLTVFWQNNWNNPEDTFDFDARRYPVRDYLNGQEFSVRDDPNYWFNLAGNNGEYGSRTNEIYNDILDKNRMAMLQDSCPIAQSTDELAFMKIEKTVLLNGVNDTDALAKYSNLIRSNPFPEQVNHNISNGSARSASVLSNLLQKLGIQSSNRYNPYTKCGAPLVYVEFRDPETGDLVRHWLLDFRLDVDPLTGDYVWEWLPQLDQLAELAQMAIGDRLLEAGDVVPFRIVTLQPYIAPTVNLPDRQAAILQLPKLSRPGSGGSRCRPELIAEYMRLGQEVPAECQMGLPRSLSELHMYRLQAVCEAFPDSPICNPPQQKLQPKCEGGSGSDECRTVVEPSGPNTHLSPPGTQPRNNYDPLAPVIPVPTASPPPVACDPETSNCEDQPPTCTDINDPECGYVKDRPWFYTYISD